MVCHLTEEATGKHRLPWCDCHLHTCIHVIGPSTGLAATSCWGAACPGVEHIINWALHLAVIDGLGALGGAEEEGSPVGHSSKKPPGAEARVLFAGACQPTEALQFLEDSISRPPLPRVTRSLRAHLRTDKTFICLLCPSHDFPSALNCAVKLNH